MFMQITAPQIVHVPQNVCLRASCRVDSSQRTLVLAMTCPWRVLSATPLIYKEVPFGSFFPRASAGNLTLLTHSPFSLSRSNGGNHREGASHALQVTLALWGAVTKSALQVLIGACAPSPVAQRKVPTGSSEVSSRSHRWFWGQRVCQRVPPRSREASISSKFTCEKNKIPS